MLDQFFFVQGTLLRLFMYRNASGLSAYLSCKIERGVNAAPNVNISLPSVKPSGRGGGAGEDKIKSCAGPSKQQGIVPRSVPQPHFLYTHVLIDSDV